MSVKELNLFFQHLKFAGMQKKLYFVYKISQDLEQILNILQKAHFIAGYTKNRPDNLVRIFLSYDVQGDCVIKEIQIISSINQRIVMNLKQIKLYLNDYPYSLVIMRTRNGILNIKTCKDKCLGGEVLAFVK